MPLVFCLAVLSVALAASDGAPKKSQQEQKETMMKDMKKVMKENVDDRMAKAKKDAEQAAKISQVKAGEKPCQIGAKPGENPDKLGKTGG